jgi:hypothetical protein
MLFSGEWGKMIHEKNLKPKSCATVRLIGSPPLLSAGSTFSVERDRHERAKECPMIAVEEGGVGARYDDIKERVPLTVYSLYVPLPPTIFVVDCIISNPTSVLGEEDTAVRVDLTILKKIFLFPFRA